MLGPEVLCQKADEPLAAIYRGEGKRVPAKLCEFFHQMT